MVIALFCFFKLSDIFWYIVVFNWKYKLNVLNEYMYICDFWLEIAIYWCIQLPGRFNNSKLTVNMPNKEMISKFFFTITLKTLDSRYDYFKLQTHHIKISVKYMYVYASNSFFQEENRPWIIAWSFLFSC